MADEQPERRKGLTCDTFSLELSQDKTGPGKGGSLNLEVWDTKGERYILVSKPVKDDADLIALLLRRIANQNGEAGWKFDANWYPSKNAGTIIG